MTQKDSTLRSHIQHGLPKDVDSKAVISQLVPARSLAAKYKLQYHIFQKEGNGNT
jgi:hypothetical protein